MKFPKISFDRPLFFTLLTLLGIGLIMIASAGVVYGRVRFGDDYYFLKQQLLGLGVGMTLLFIFQQIHYAVWKRFVVPIFFDSFGAPYLGFHSWIWHDSIRCGSVG